MYSKGFPLCVPKFFHTYKVCFCSCPTKCTLPYRKLEKNLIYYMKRDNLDKRVTNQFTTTSVSPSFRVNFLNSALTYWNTVVLNLVIQVFINY